MDYDEADYEEQEGGLVLAVINQKGGVGKSTTCVNLSAALGELGKTVLLVDLDPQGNSTSGYGIDKAACSQCIYDAMMNEVPIEDLIIKTCGQNVWIVPATINLTGAEIELVEELERELRLLKVLGEVRHQYDYVLIDCPPSLGLLTINALTAADQILIPIQSEFYALEGVSKLLDTVKIVKSSLNPDLEIFGVLLTMYDKRTTLAKQVHDEVRSYFGEKTFDVCIPRTVKLSEAPGFGVPITYYASMNKGAVAYRKLAKEVINRG